MIIFSSILTSIDVLVSVLYQRLTKRDLESGLRFNFLVGLFSSIIFLTINKFQVEFTLFSCIAAVVMTAIAIVYVILGFSIIADGKAAYYTFFRMTGAMLVPYIWGLFFLKEEFSLLRACGIFLIVSAIFLINSDKQNISFRNILMCIGVFFLAGDVSIISKQHAISNMAVSAVDYVILTSFAKIVLCGTVLLFLRNKRKQPESCKTKLYVSGLCAASAVITGVAYMIQLVCAESMPATLLYPVITGGTIIFSAIFTRIVFKEKLPGKAVIAIIICFAGTCMFI